jgi:hypothetical protein
MVSPAWPGPPAFGVVGVSGIMTCGSVKVCRPVTVETMTVKRMTGRSIGSVIRKNVCTGPAPSIFAAS